MWHYIYFILFQQASSVRLLFLYLQVEVRSGRFKKSKIGMNPTRAVRPGGSKHKTGEHQAQRDEYTTIYDWNEKFVMIVSGDGVWRILHGMLG